MAKKKQETKTVDIEQLRKFIKDYLLFDKAIRGISAGEPPVNMINAMAEDMSKNNKFKAHTVNRINIMWEKTPEERKTEEIKAMYDELQQEIGNLN